MDVLPSGRTIDAEYYCNLLDQLKISIQQKRRRMIDNAPHNIHYLHDNARSHAAIRTARKLQELQLTVLPHPPYSPDLAPSDFYLFSPLKSSLAGKSFASRDEILRDVNTWIESKPCEFFRNGIQKLPERWQRCIEANGEYFEHLKDID